MDHAIPRGEELPEMLTDRAQWVCWREEERDGRPTKVPVDPNTGSFASATDPATWSEFDEARYLMKDTATLDYLETIFRHHRHHDLSIRLITQTVDEFLDHDVAKIILDQCAVKQFHKLDGMDERVANEFGLNHAQMRYVQQAVPGSEAFGYSQALLGVDGEWRGIEVRATGAERDVIDGKNFSAISRNSDYQTNRDARDVIV